MPHEMGYINKNVICTSGLMASRLNNTFSKMNAWFFFRSYKHSIDTNKQYYFTNGNSSVLGLQWRSLKTLLLQCLTIRMLLKGTRRPTIVQRCLSLVLKHMIDLDNSITLAANRSKPRHPIHTIPYIHNILKPPNDFKHAPSWLRHE